MRAPASPAARRSWLCPTETDERRMNEALEGSRRARVGGAAVTCAALLACVPWLGWMPLVGGVVAVLATLVTARLFGRSTFAAHVHVLSFAVMFAAILHAAAWSGGPTSPVLPMTALPVLLLAGRFRRTVAVTGLAVAAVAVVATMLALFPERTLDHPEGVAVTLFLLAGAVAITASFSQVEDRLREHVHTDPLTGLLNRLGLDARFARVAEDARAADEAFSLVLLDIDHFKRVNDDHGHDVGDVVLARVASILSTRLRDADLVFRLGGEEFAVLLPNVGAGNAASVAERLRAAVSEEPLEGIAVTVSAGIATSGPHGEGWRGLYRRADAALLAAKRSGRDRCVAFGDITLPFRRHELR